MLPVLIAANIVAGTFCLVFFASMIDRNSARYNAKFFIVIGSLLWVFGLPIILANFLLSFVMYYTMFPKRGWSPVVG